MTASGDSGTKLAATASARAVASEWPPDNVGQAMIVGALGPEGANRRGARAWPYSVHSGVENLVLGRIGRIELGDDSSGAGDQDAVGNGENLRQIG